VGLPELADAASLTLTAPYMPTFWKFSLIIKRFLGFGMLHFSKESYLDLHARTMPMLHNSPAFSNRSKENTT
jgi:hypothetical protein